MRNMGKVHFVGAGCGDFELITMRGMKLIRNCDVLIYDSLIDDRLLDFAPQEAEKICVGKRCGYHSVSQENINKLIVEKAASGKVVVRLKGGDPFVFGRGGEEIMALREHDIPYDVVPGITSAVAATELAGIPVTHRRVSRSFHVITGHTADSVLPEKLNVYARLEGTLVFLMGLGNIKKITDGLISGGMSGETPAAVISKGATSEQFVLRGKLNDIAILSEREEIEAPAVIVVGETAGMDLTPIHSAPTGKISVTVTGTRKFAEKLCSKLSLCGVDTVLLHTLDIKEYTENREFDSALRSIGNYGCIVFTSTNGAEIFFKRMRALKIDIRSLGNIRFAVIGSGTADSLEKYGIFADLIPKQFTSAALGNLLAENVRPSERLLILRAENGSEELAEILASHKVNFDEIKIYKAESAKKRPGISEISTDYLTFASASGVKAFFDSDYNVSEKTKIICIGDMTANALRLQGISRFDIAEVQNVNGIVDKIIQEV